MNRLPAFAPCSVLAAAVLTLSACAACSFGADLAATTLTVATWNAQTLFDGVETGSEYDDYRASADWSDAKYRSRLDAIGAALLSAVPDGPDILALQEIESAEVLKALSDGPLSRFGYRWAACARSPGAALAVGLLSRLPLAAVRIHSVEADGLEGARPILEAVLAGERPLTVFVCHWKSKLGGAAETERYRRAQARIIARRLAALAAESVNAASPEAIVLGDLNENIDEFWLAGGIEPTALLPDDPLAAAALTADEKTTDAAAQCLVLSAERPPRSANLPEAAALYSPWNDSAWEGSYHYDGRWERIDHVLATAALFDGRSWEYRGFRVIDSSPFADEAGLPVAYNPRTGRGLSDHLPLIAEFEYLE